MCNLVVTFSDVLQAWILVLGDLLQNEEAIQSFQSNINMKKVTIKPYRTYQHADRVLRMILRVLHDLADGFQNRDAFKRRVVQAVHCLNQLDATEWGEAWMHRLRQDRFFILPDPSFGNMAIDIKTAMYLHALYGTVDVEYIHTLSTEEKEPHDGGCIDHTGPMPGTPRANS